jgi:hypothetical protein
MSVIGKDPKSPRILRKQNREHGNAPKVYSRVHGRVSEQSERIRCRKHRYHKSSLSEAQNTKCFNQK